MSTGWSIFVVVMVLGNIAGYLWLLFATAKRQPGEVPEGAEKDHVWDDDLRELNNPMPRWWLHLFVITIIFGLGYMVAYPGLGNFPGLLGWTQAQQHDERLAEVQERRQVFYSAFEGREITELADDPAARRFGSELYALHCAGCHGLDGAGATGFPNLANGHWQWGGSPQAISTSITRGRRGVMPPLGAAIPDAVLPELVTLIRNWSDPPLDEEALARAKQQYQRSCAACHGAEAKGNPALGAPDMTDGVWLYGGDADSVRHSIVAGRRGEMPAFGGVLTDMDIKLLSGFVYGLSPDRE